jgi:hypothetical protein
MRKFFSNHNLLIPLAAILLGLNFLSFHVITDDETSHSWEKFNHNLVGSLRSVDDILKYADSIALRKSIEKGTLGYAIELDNIVKDRFTHGYSHYNFKENWIAASAGFIWRDFSAIVIPDDLLKYSYGSCSQQSIVLMECMKRRNIPYRTVYFPTHFALEGYFNNNWFFFDPDLEPALTLGTITNFDSLSRSEQLYKIYKSSNDSLSIATTLSSFSYGAINAKQAPKSVIFHKFTKALSKTLWILPLILYFIFLRKRKKRMRLSLNGSKMDLKNNLIIAGRQESPAR